MIIDGPLRIALEEDPAGQYRLNVDFTDVFRALPAERRGAVLCDYIARLRQAMAPRDPDDRERQGMATVLQLAEALLPHIQADEIDLAETIVVEVEQDSPLAELLRPENLH